MIESCFGVPVTIIALVLAIVALYIASSLRSQLDRALGEILSLRKRLQLLENLFELSLKRDAPPTDAADQSAPQASDAEPLLTPAEPEPAEPSADIPAESEPSPPATPPMAIVEPLDAAPSVVDDSEPLSREPESAIDDAPALAPERERKVTLEEKLGARAFVWVAAVAIALAGAYFVKYSFDNNLISAKLRIIIATCFGVGLIVGGYLSHHRIRRIASALVAAGVTTLLAATFAAVHVEHLISTAAGFVAMAVITAAAVALSLRHGPIVALIALIGGFATPAIVGRVEQPTTTLLLYVLLLEIGLVTITRRRAWYGLMVLTLVGGYGWSIAWLIMMWNQPGMTGGAFALFLTASAVAFIIGPAAMQQGRDDLTGRARAVINITRWIGAIVGLVLVAAVVRGADFAVTHWMYLGFLSAGCMAVDRFDVRMRGVTWLAMLCCAAGFMAWPHADEPMRFAWTLLAFGALFAGGGYACLWRSDRAHDWAIVSVVAAGAFSLFGYIDLDFLPWPHYWASHCAILAALYALAARPVYKRRDVMPHGEAALAALCTAVAVAIACIVPLELNREWISVAWALLAPAVLVVHLRLRIDALAKIAMGFAALAAVRLLANPGVFEYPIGQTIVFNWLLYGYGVPAGAMALSAWLLVRAGRDDRHTRAYEILAVMYGFVLLALEVRHGFHRPAALGETTEPFQLIEAATYPIAWMLLAFALLGMYARRPRPMFMQASQALAWIAVASAALLVGIVENPVGEPFDLGSMLIANWLLYAYGVPLALCAAMAWALYRIEPDRAKGCGFEIVAMIIAVLLVSLEVRHSFQREDMHVFGHMGLVEAATYGIAWLVMAIALFALDRRTRREVWFQSGAIIAAMGALEVVLVVALMKNPLWVSFDLGSTKLLNWLLYAFGLPMVLMGTAARIADVTGKRESMRGLCVALYWVAFVLSFALVSLEVRHAFQGSIILAEQGLTPAENYTHTAAWLLYGAALLALGIRLKQPIVRYVSLGVMILTVGKVFLWDMRQLRDLWRVLSFLGLGVSLLVLAYVYQRFVFRMRDETTD